MYVQDEDKFWDKIFLEDIYYIETIKSTHYCIVEHKKGRGKLRADIYVLEQEFIGYLYKVKASTLVNPNLIKKIHLEARLLYFAANTYCSYAARCTKELKIMLGIRNYRKLEKKGKDYVKN